MRLFLVRHGETEWNLSGRWQGWEDSNLTAKGREQAVQHGIVLRNAGIERIFASPLPRVRATLDGIQLSGAFQIEFDDRLKEISMGDWEGLTESEVKARYAQQHQRRQRDREHFGATNGESYSELKRRLASFLMDSNLVATSSGPSPSASTMTSTCHLMAARDVAIVSHGTATKLMLELFGAIESAATDRRGVANHVIHVVQQQGSSLRFSHYRSGEGPIDGICLQAH